MPTQVIELGSTGRYKRWLREWADEGEVLDVASTNRWGCLLRFLGSSKTLTVTFRGPDEAVRRQWGLIQWMIIASLVLIAVMVLIGEAVKLSH